MIVFMIENVPGSVPLVRDGRLKALAITSSHRSPLVPDLPPRPAGLPVATPPEPGLFARILKDLSYSSALAKRLQDLLTQYRSPGTPDAAPGAARTPGADGREWPKPDYTLVWPAGVDEKDPDLARKDLPVTLSAILADLGRIEATTKAVGGELAVASFKWLVEDGMVLDPVRHRFILEYLNFGYAPFRYRDLARLALFQNRVLEKYAKEHRIDFLDVARLMPSDPDLFIDAIHGTTEGIRLRAWIMLQLLVPVIDRHLADGAWPKKSFPDVPLPAPYKPRVVTFQCEQKKG